MTLPRAAGIIAGFAATAAAAVGCGGGGAPTPPANASPGLKVFDKANCGSCHTLAAAHATGKVGKNLNRLRLDTATVGHWLRTGGGGMPVFTGQLSDTEIATVAEYVARSSQ